MAGGLGFGEEGEEKRKKTADGGRVRGRTGVGVSWVAGREQRIWARGGCARSGGTGRVHSWMWMGG